MMMVLLLRILILLRPGASGVHGMHGGHGDYLAVLLADSAGNA
jgi:hypothetical protein